MLRTLLAAQTQFELLNLVEKYIAQGWRKVGEEFSSSAAPFEGIQRNRYWQLMEKPLDPPKIDDSSSPFANPRKSTSAQ
jgi:hypothetical protein